MRDFQAVADLVIARHDRATLHRLLNENLPLSREEITSIPDDRWLAMATKCVFQAGFNWKVIEAKWDGFEAAFERFDLGRWVLSSDDDLAMLVSDKRIVRNPQKIRTVPDNARFMAEISHRHGGFGSWIADWPSSERNELLDTLARGGSRLGTLTGQYFLRFMGVDCYILSRDVTAALMREGIIDKQPTSKRAKQAVQEAFNQWMSQSGHGLTVISRVLAHSI